MAAAPSGSAGAFFASSSTRATSPRTALAMCETALRSPSLLVEDAGVDLGRGRCGGLAKLRIEHPEQLRPLLVELLRKGKRAEIDGPTHFRASLAFGRGQQ